MTRDNWTLHRSKELDEAIADLEPLLQEQVELDIKKLKSRGIRGAVPPLVKHLDGDVYYLRSMVRGYGWFRLFYFQNGRTSFFGFYGHFKKRDRLPSRVVSTIMKKFEQYKHNRER